MTHRRQKMTRKGLDVRFYEATNYETVLKVLARHLGIAQRERATNPDCQYTFGMLREVEEIIEQIGAEGLEPLNDG